MLKTAIEAEVEAYIEAHVHSVDEDGHRRVVPNGAMPDRTIQTSIGPIDVRQPRVHDCRQGEDREQFTSMIKGWFQAA